MAYNIDKSPSLSTTFVHLRPPYSPLCDKKRDRQWQQQRSTKLKRTHDNSRSPCLQHQHSRTHSHKDKYSLHTQLSQQCRTASKKNDKSLVRAQSLLFGQFNVIEFRKLMPIMTKCCAHAHTHTFGYIESQESVSIGIRASYVMTPTIARWLLLLLLLLFWFGSI